jgi:hypothetical protein
MKKIRELSHIIDPNQIGPFDRCLTCFTPNSHNFTFCQTCGHIHGFFNVPYDAYNEYCFVHKNVLAVTYCTLCGRPICKECIEREGFSFIGGRHTPMCRSCIDKSNKLETEFKHLIRVCFFSQNSLKNLGISLIFAILV